MEFPWIPRKLLPYDGKGMMHFGGMVSYLREMSPKVAELMALLDGLWNCSKITWTDELRVSFTAVKELFAQDIELRYFDPRLPVYFHANMGDTTISAWAGYMDSDGRIRPFICYSKKLSPTERCWGARKKELFAAIQGMRKFATYPRHCHFIHLCDH